MHYAKLSAARLLGPAILVTVFAACSSRLNPRGVTAAVPEASGVARQFVGAWKLVRQEGRNVQSGEVIPAMTSEAWPGLLVYSPDGWMSVAIDRRTTGGSYWGYFGKFSVSADTITHHIVGGIPSARGPSPALFAFADQGHRLTISTLPNAQGGVVHFFFVRAD
jgi:hypothetical protein